MKTLQPATADPIEDRSAQILFQGGDSFADRRLGQVQVRGGPGKRAFAGDGHEGDEGVQVYHMKIWNALNKKDELEL